MPPRVLVLNRSLEVGPLWGRYAVGVAVVNVPHMPGARSGSPAGLYPTYSRQTSSAAEPPVRTMAREALTGRHGTPAGPFFPLVVAPLSPRPTV